MRQGLVWLGFFLVTSRVIRSWSILELVQHLESENSFNYVVIVGESKGFLPQMLSELSVPVILFDDKPNINYNLDKHHSRNLLIVAYVDETINRLLDFYDLNLRLWNTEPLLLIMKNTIRVGLLESCWQRNQILNVLAIFEDFEVRLQSFDYVVVLILGTMVVSKISSIDSSSSSRKALHATRHSDNVLKRFGFPPHPL